MKIVNKFLFRCFFFSFMKKYKCSGFTRKLGFIKKTYATANPIYNLIDLS